MKENCEVFTRMVWEELDHGCSRAITKGEIGTLSKTAGVDKRKRRVKNLSTFEPNMAFANQKPNLYPMYRYF